MSSALDILGIDLEDLEWPPFALCKGLDTNTFYDLYEQDEFIAKATDELCSSCPVRKQCLRQGIENSEWGVWGGLYLVAGKPDKNRNSHKTAEDWKEVREVISESVHT
jgi:hypothetical protein